GRRRGGRPGPPRPGVRRAAPDDADDAPRRPGAASRAPVTGDVAGGPRARGAPAAPAHGARVAPRPRPGTRPDRGRGGRLRMTRVPLDALTRAVVESGATGVTARAADALECRVAAREIPALADRPAQLGATCQFLAAADTRVSSG